MSLVLTKKTKLLKHVLSYNYALRATPPTNPQPVSLNPSQIAKALNFPDLADDPAKYAVWVVELGGYMVHQDIQLYASQQKFKAPILNDFFFDGATATPSGPNGADGEVGLDQCVIAEIVPGVRIDTGYGANSDQGFADTILGALTKPAVRSSTVAISWGGPESSWDSSGISIMQSALAQIKAANMGLYVAAGDNGSSDGVGDGSNHVDYPASDPNATACGGSRLVLNPDGSRYSETVWDINNGNGSTGGGFSSLFPVPDYQLGIAGRGSYRSVPDIAGNADPVSGYNVDVDFLGMAIGGTSAVAPLMAGLHVLLQTHFKNPIGNLNEFLYKLYANNPTAFYDITSGSNGSYSAQVGFDQCSGLGVPDGTKLLQGLKDQGYQ